MRIGTRVRSTSDGQLGFITEGETGGLMVRLDRRGENRMVPFRSGDWHEEVAAPLSEMQIARVCHDADRAYRLVNGAYTQPEWIALTERDRIAWSKGLPAAPGMDVKRVRLYDAIRKAIK